MFLKIQIHFYWLGKRTVTKFIGPFPSVRIAEDKREEFEIYIKNSQHVGEVEVTMNPTDHSLPSNTTPQDLVAGVEADIKRMRG